MQGILGILKGGGDPTAPGVVGRELVHWDSGECSVGHECGGVPDGLPYFGVPGCARLHCHCHRLCLSRCQL